MVSAAGNHPHVLKSILISPVRPVVTSTPSASNSWHWNWAPCVPGPRDEMVPLLDTTRCHGTGGFVLGERNFKANSRAVRSQVTMSIYKCCRDLVRRVGNDGASQSVSLCGLYTAQQSSEWNKSWGEEIHRSLWPFGLESVVRHGRPWKLQSSTLNNVRS